MFYLQKNIFIVESGLKILVKKVIGTSGSQRGRYRPHPPVGGELVSTGMGAASKSNLVGSTQEQYKFL